MTVTSEDIEVWARYLEAMFNLITRPPRSSRSAKIIASEHLTSAILSSRERVAAGGFHFLVGLTAAHR